MRRWTHIASVATLLLTSVSLTFFIGVSSVFAQTTRWNGSTSTDWHNAANWDSGLPNAGTDVEFRAAGGGSGVRVDLNGTSVTVNNVTQNNFGPTRATPAIITSTGGPATINFNTWRVTERKSGMIFEVDMSGNLFESGRKAFTQEFKGMLTLTDGASGRGQSTWVLDGGADFQGGLDLRFQASATGGKPTVNANSIVNFGTGGDANALNIGDQGRYNANVDGAMGDAASVINIADDGRLIVNASQTSAGTVNVNNSTVPGPQSGVTEGYAFFDATDINLANLSVNTPFVADTSSAEISAGSSVIVNGKLSGAGQWGGPGTLHIAGTGSVSPGNSIDTITGTNLNIMDGGTYEFEIQDPDGGPGVGWDLIDVDNLTFDGDWTLDIIDFGLTRDIDPSEEFVIAMMDTTNFDVNNAMITLPSGWFLGPDPLFLDGNGDLVLTGVSNVSQAVPEPHTLAIWSLLGLAMGGFIFYRMRRR